MARITTGSNGAGLVLAASLALSTLASAAEKITYEDHIFPLFEQSCLNCHNPDKKKGDLDLSSYPALLKGGSGGEVATPGDGASSKLFQVTTGSVEPVMPPEGDKITKDASDLIRSWIDGGMLETQNSTARKSDKPKFDAVAPASGKPEGPPPMPESLPLEPSFVAGRPGLVAAMTAAPWAPLLAIAGQKQVLFYHTDTFEYLGALPFHKGQPQSLTFDPSGKYLLAAGGVGGKSGQAVMWDITTGQELFTAGREFDSILAAAPSPDLGRIAFGGPSRLLKIWDTREDEQIASIKKHTEWITSVAWSPDGKFIASGDRNGGIHVWDKDGNEIHALRDHQKSITALNFRADSQLLASASEDGQFIIWDLKKGEPVKKQSAHGPGITAFHYAANGHLMTAGRDRQFKVFKPDFNGLHDFTDVPELITAVAISHDQQRFFVACFDGQIQAFENSSWKHLGSLESNPPHLEDRINGLAGELQQRQTAVEEAKKILAQTREPLTRLETQLAGTKEALTRNGGLLAASSGKVAEKENSLRALGEEINGQKAPRQELESQVRVSREALKNAEDLVAKAGDDSAVKDAEGKVGEARKTLDEAENRFREHETAGQELQKRKDAANGELSVLRQQTNDLRGLVKQGEEDIRNLEQKIAEAAKSLEEPSAKVNEAEAALNLTMDRLAHWKAVRLREMKRLQSEDNARFQELAADERSQEEDEEFRSIRTRIDERAKRISEME